MPASAAAYCCYLLRSLASERAASARTYIGITNNLPRRLRQHNGELANGAKYTRACRPWIVVAFVSGFETQQQALMFEWAFKNVSRKRRGGPKYTSGRRTSLRVLLNKERWTAKSPAAASVPLVVHWLPGPAGEPGEKLGPPLRAEVTEVLEPAGGMEAWAAVAQLAKVKAEARPGAPEPRRSRHAMPASKHESLMLLVAAILLPSRLFLFFND